MESRGVVCTVGDRLVACKVGVLPPKSAQATRRISNKTTEAEKFIIFKKVIFRMAISITVTENIDFYWKVIDELNLVVSFLAFSCKNIYIVTTTWAILWA